MHDLHAIGELMRRPLLALLFAATATHAAPPDPPTVIVPGARIAIGWPYATLAAGMVAFEDERALAPQATLRFHLLLAPGVAVLANVALTLVDGDHLARVPITPEGFFRLDHTRRADGAQLAASRNGGQFDGNRAPQPDVRTPGLPDHVRRLGDLRLECRVKMAMAKEMLGFMQRTAISALGGSDWCAPRKGGGYMVDTALPVAHATLSQGTRTLALPVRGGSAVTVPIADNAWSDDALITFQHGPGLQALPGQTSPDQALPNHAPQ
jgi:hypothetical protein